MTITRLPNRRALSECVGKAHLGTAAIGCPTETERRDDRKVGTGGCEEMISWGELAWAHMFCDGVKVVVVGWLSHPLYAVKLVSRSKQMLYPDWTCAVC
jgi:hypothetical protein